MISVLIPVYNYDITDLIEKIHSQLMACKIPFETIALEDGSDSKNISTNQVINSLSNTKLIISKPNIGRIAARQMLSDTAKFEWLLFIDADTMPKSENFISTYVNFISSDFDAIYGGCAYKDAKPNSDYMLRWVYGKAREEVSAETRNVKPYKSIVSVNFMIRKTVFNHINSKINYKGYGLDNIFGALLKTNHIKINHINNEVYHLGIEESSIYIEKKEKAAETLLLLYRDKKLSNHKNDLLILFNRLKNFRLNYLAALFYSIFKNSMKRNLTGNHPSIKILQLYRLTYMCHFDLNSKQ